MITVNNYTDKAKHINFSKMPDVLQKGSESMDMMLEFYDEMPQIKKTIDTFISELNIELEATHQTLGVIEEERKVSATFLNSLKYVSKLMPKHQLKIMRGNNEMYDELIRIDKALGEIPTKEQDSKDPTVFAHYFYGGSDWYILDREKDYSTYFGYAILNDDVQMSEFGRVGISEIVDNGKVELDFYFKPDSLKKILYKRDKNYFKNPEKEKPKKITDNIEAYDEKYIGKNVIIMLRKNNQTRSITFKNGNEKKYNRNNKKDLEILWKLANTKKDFIKKHIIVAKVATKTKAKKQVGRKSKREITLENIAKYPPKPAPKKVGKVIDKDIVDHYSQEFMLIRRFNNLLKTKGVVTFRKIQLLFMAFEKAAIERKVRKVSADATLFTEVNNKVVKLFNATKKNEESVKVKLGDNGLKTKLENYVQGRAVNYAISLLKRFIGLQGTQPETEKVSRLIRAIDLAIEKGRVKRTNRLFSEVGEAKKALNSYLKAPTTKIEATPQGLSKPVIITKIKDIPKIKEEVDKGRVTYRGLGLGILFDKFYDIARENGTRITVNKKEYFITSTDFKKLGGIKKIKFKAPFRKQ